MAHLARLGTGSRGCRIPGLRHACCGGCETGSDAQGAGYVSLLPARHGAPLDGGGVRRWKRWARRRPAQDDRPLDASRGMRAVVWCSMVSGCSRSPWAGRRVVPQSPAAGGRARWRGMRVPGRRGCRRHCRNGHGESRRAGSRRRGCGAPGRWWCWRCSCTRQSRLRRRGRPGWPPPGCRQPACGAASARAARRCA